MSETRLVSHLRIHERAAVVPFPDPDQHGDLTDDIAAHGVQVPLDILPDGTILDGRTRYMISKALGITELPVRYVVTDDPVGYMLRMALRRRHLTTQQRKALAESLLALDPARSDRSVAEETGLSPTTVGAVRAEAEATGRLSRLDSRTGIDGRTRTLPERTPEPTPDPVVSWVEGEDPDLGHQVRSGVIDLPTAVAVIDDRHDAEQLAAGEQAAADRAAYAARSRALTPEQREAEETARASAEWHRTWAGVVRVTALDPEAVLSRMTPDEHIAVRAGVRSLRTWLDRVEQAMRTDGLRAIQGGRS